MVRAAHGNSPARHGGCKKRATAAPLAFSRYAGEGSSEGFGCHIPATIESCTR